MPACLLVRLSAHLKGSPYSYAKHSVFGDRKGRHVEAPGSRAHDSFATPGADGMEQPESVEAAAPAAPPDVVATNGEAAAAPADAAGAVAEDAPKPKKSRWGNKEPVPSPAEDGASRKRSRWGKKEEPADPLLMAVQMGIPLATLQHMSAKQQEMLPQLKQRVDEIDLLLRLPDCGVSEIPPERRSPSPDPVFDRAGTRVNSREARRRSTLEKERQSVLDSLKPKQPYAHFPPAIHPQPSLSPAQPSEQRCPRPRCVTLRTGARSSGVRLSYRSTSTLDTTFLARSSALAATLRSAWSASRVARSSSAARGRSRRGAAGTTGGSSARRTRSRCTS